VKGVAKLPALGPLSGLGGGEHLFDPAVAGEEVDRGEESLSVRQGHCDNDRCSSFLTMGLTVGVEVAIRDNGDSPGIAEGLMKRGEQLIVI